MKEKFQLYSSISKIASAVFEDLKDIFSWLDLTKLVLFRLQPLKSDCVMLALTKRLLYRFVPRKMEL